MTDQPRKRRITVPLVDRANYGRMKPVLEALHACPDVELQIICTGSMVLERFASPVKEVLRDGLPVCSEVYIEVEGSIPSTMAKSVGMGVIEFASELQRLKPDIVLCIGDRYEMLAFVVAASCMNICIAHVQGGEVSGSIDESIRHAISKFAQYHFPSTRRAADYLIAMGESPDTVFHVGCPSSDIARRNRTLATSEMVNSTGSGAKINLAEPYALVVFHPVTTAFGEDVDDVMDVLNALERVGMQTVWLWPNIDAGADHVSKVLRQFRDERRPAWLRLAKNFGPEAYASLLAKATVAVGNSSSFVRDSGFYGTPVVLVGDRQKGREFSHNVLPVRVDADAIYRAVQKHLVHGRYPPSTLYGDGNVAPRIARILTEVPLYVQKTIDYINRDFEEQRTTSPAHREHWVPSGTLQH
jgi:UDP-hydrolysing UDP-N-acetyl-D-glucosamine 2-epimerase